MHGGVRPWWQHGSSETYRVAAGRVLAAVLERGALGVRLARRLSDALADHAAVLDDHGPTIGFGLVLPARAPGELDRPQKMLRVVLCDGHGRHC